MPATSTYGYRVQASTSFEATFQAGAAYTGLVGTVGVAIYDGVGGTALARRTTGIVEATTGSGTYTATLTSPATNGQYVVEFDTGGGTPQYAADDLTVAAEASLADAGIAGPSETVVLDPTSEDASNIQVSLTGPSTGINLISQDYPPPDRDRLFAGSADTFGDPLVQSRYRDRTITLVVRCYGGEATMRARVRDLTKKAGKLAQYGGTLRRTLNDGTVITFDVLDCDIQVPADWMFLHSNSVQCTLTLLAKPAGRGTATTYTTVTETTAPAIQVVVTAPAGDLPARGSLVITDASGHDQRYMQWGVQGPNYPGTATASTTAALLYAGTSRLALNGATAWARTGAVSGVVLNQGTLTNNYTAMMSLADSGTAYCTHVGNYNVWARMYAGTANAGTVSVALEWSAGDFQNVTTNTPSYLEPWRSGQFAHVPLGQVHLTRTLAGAQRWDGNIIAKSGVFGDKVAVDEIYLFPTDDGYGEARGLVIPTTPTVFLARDEFNQTTGALTGKTLPIGGTWAGSALSAGGTAEFTVDATNHYLTRSTSPNTSRFIHNGTSYATVAVQVDVQATATTAPTNQTASGLAARFVDANNFLYALLGGIGTVAGSSITFTTISVVKIVAGTTQTIKTQRVDFFDWTTLRLVVDAEGRWSVFACTQGQALREVCSGQHDDLATGGALATGKAGIVEDGANVTTRRFDNFQLFTPSADAATFAVQSLRIAHDHAIREDSTGTYTQQVSSYRGSYLRIPASNAAGTVRLLVKGSRNLPEAGADSGVDDITAALTVTPLYLNVP